MVIKTLAAHLFCSWKLDSSALFMDLLIFQRCKYFASILKVLVTHYLLRIHLSVLESSAKFVIRKHLRWREVSIFNKLQAWGMQLYLKRDSDTGVFQWIWWNFEENLFYRKSSRRLLLHFHLNCCFHRSFLFSLARFWLTLLASCELKKKITLMFFLLRFCFCCLHYLRFQPREKSVTMSFYSQPMRATSALHK